MWCRLALQLKQITVIEWRLPFTRRDGLPISRAKAALSGNHLSKVNNRSVVSSQVLARKGPLHLCNAMGTVRPNQRRGQWHSQVTPTATMATHYDSGQCRQNNSLM